jgi:AcrR family transcriptional regulator
MTHNPNRAERSDAQRNLARVLQAANELFAERGTEVTMEEVARRAGVGIGTIYRRFPSKEHLFAAVSHAACAEAQSRLERAVQTEREPVGRLRALVQVHYQRCSAQSALLDVQQNSPAEKHELYSALHSMVQQSICDGQHSGTVRDGDPAVLATLCLELLNPRAFQHLARIIGDDDEQIVDQVVQFVLHGLSRNESK